MYKLNKLASRIKQEIVKYVESDVQYDCRRSEIGDGVNDKWNEVNKTKVLTSQSQDYVVRYVGVRRQSCTEDVGFRTWLQCMCCALAC